MEKEIAIKVKEISKTFRIPASPAGGPHEKISTLRRALFQPKLHLIFI